MTLVINPYRVAAPAFAPSDITGLAVWLKADGTLYQDSARTTLATADTDPVGSWSDASGNARHASQATSTKRPLLKLSQLNSQPALQFDDVDDWMATATFTAIAQPATEIAVFKRDASDVGHGIVADGNSSTSNRHLIQIDSGQINLYAGYLYSNTAKVPGTTARAIATIWNGGSSKFWMDGGANQAMINVGTHSIIDVLLAAGQGPGDFFKGLIAEYLLYDSSLSLTDLDRVGSYLSTKYGVTWAAAS